MFYFKFLHTTKNLIRQPADYKLQACLRIADRQANLGFTLLETIIYIAIISVTLTTIIGFSFNISNVKIKTAVMSEVQYNLGFTEDFMKRIALESGGLDSNNSVFDNNDSVLSMFLADGSGTKTISLNNEQLKFDNISLSTGKVLVEKFNLTKISSSTVAVDIDINFNSRAENGSYYQASGNKKFILEFKR